MLSINNSSQAGYSQAKSNVNFTSRIVPNEMAKEGFEFAKTITSKSNFYEQNLLKEFVESVKTILNDGKKHIVKVFQSGERTPSNTVHSIAINEKPVVECQKFCDYPKRGFEFMEAVIDLTKQRGVPSTYEKVIAKIEKREPQIINSVKSNNVDMCNQEAQRLEEIVFKKAK